MFALSCTLQIFTSNVIKRSSDGRLDVGVYCVTLLSLSGVT